MNTNDLQFCVRMRESLCEQLRQSIWTEAEREDLRISLQTTCTTIDRIRQELVADGFTQELVDALERQYCMEYMEA